MARKCGAGPGGRPLTYAEIKEQILSLLAQADGELSTAEVCKAIGMESRVDYLRGSYAIQKLWLDRKVRRVLRKGKAFWSRKGD